MGWSEGEKRCKKHPEHKQSKGVCPNCLRERLQHLSASSSTSTSMNATSTTSTSPRSDGSSATAASPPRRTAGPLKKSRSLAFIIDREKEKEKRERRKEMKRNRKRTGRFWSRLLSVSLKRREDGGLEHSKTLKEKSTTKWSFFS